MGKGAWRGSYAVRGLTVPSRAVRVVPWQLEVAQLLDEHHVCAWSNVSRQRERFVIDLGTNLCKLEGSQVCSLHGTCVHDLKTFCQQLELALDVGPIATSIDGSRGVVAAMRRRQSLDSCGDQRSVKRRYLVWNDADALLKHDAELFGRVADALMGVCAEEEFINEDLLMLQRVVFVGRAALDLYAEDARGQFCSWFSEGGEDPLWSVITGLKSPPLTRYAIGNEVDAPRA